MIRSHEADFVRLDALIAHGGVYADIDTLFVHPVPARLFDITGMPLAGRTLAFSLRGQQVSGTTDGNGRARVQLAACTGTVLRVV